MSEAKFTKGQWAVTGQSEGGRYITVKSETGRVVSRVPWNTERDLERNEITDCHDANLIAAAPDMYDALKALIAGIEEYALYKNGTFIIDDVLVPARAALSKATGGK
jgi:hypothetical protein